ncbi:MAG: hypothetical protein C4291_04870 [Candidatus Dadabacteria bacterium]
MEIISETTRDNDLGRKLKIYREHLTKEIWIIDPGEKTVQIPKLLKEGYKIQKASNGTLKSSIIPGFFIHPEWLFISPRPKVRECFEEILASNELL